MADDTAGSSRSFRIRSLSVLKRLVAVQAGEARAFLWSWAYFFVLLCSYYIVRPMRDEMGIAGGVKQLQWMFSGTFVLMLVAVPLFGWVTRRYAPCKFLPYVYSFFIVNLLIFYLLFACDLTHAYVARAFFIWASVFNLFIVSVFWSFMADIFDTAQAKRLFGAIAAGGTAGALTGPVLTAALVIHLGPTNLLLLSVLFLGLAVVCIRRLIQWRQTIEHGPPGKEKGGGAIRSTADNVIGGSILAGIRLVLASPYLLGIGLLLLFFTTLATFLYFQQAHIINDRIADPARRTALFAAMDFSVNALTLIGQLLLTGRMVNKFGLGWTLALVPLLLGAGFLVLGAAPILGVVVAVQVIRRAGNYAITRPAREMLYVVVSQEEKYKAKNVIDTVVYRGGDAVSAWAYAGLRAMGLTISQIAWLAVPLAGIWAWVAFRLGHAHRRLSASAADHSILRDRDKIEN